jgi:hypothetical protein
MPTEWPPKQPAPKPSGPDPAAVRAALAEIDEARTQYECMHNYYTYGRWREAVTDNWITTTSAARAWLAQQGEASE